jgi:hypothetical protein
MAGLSNYLTDTAVTKEALPSWFTGAQEELVKGAKGVTGVPIGQTVAPAAQAAFSPSGAFATGQSMLESIGSGAANPWITSTDATGRTMVSPNVATPMGGLFQAQSDYLNQILPDIQAAETAKYIGGGGFGSRMNLSGVERAKAAAAADLFQKQMQSALQAQQTGVQAGAGLGNIGAQQAQEAIDTATFQQAYPYADLVNLANIYKTMGPALGKTTEVSTKLSLPRQLGALSTIFGGGQQGLQGLTGNLSNFFNWAGSALSGSGSGSGSSGSGGDSNYSGDYYGWE